MMDLLEDADPGRNEPEYTVSELSGAVKKTLEGAFGRVRVRGEVGRVMRAASGHVYYDLKDDRGVLACTTWKGQVRGLGVMPEEGLEVIATGKISSFAPQSKYNMNVDSLEVAGEGALMLLLEKRKKALEAEGLFAAARKRTLPYLPGVIGVVTSLQGAVIRDILHRLRERFPRKVLIWPVAVQGARCAPQVSEAIAGFNALTPGGPVPRPDLIIVARGGGSIEDLWGFNEEAVARAVAASEIPLISAVGHETDTTLIDYVSDRRAPTPTAAAEMAVPVRLDLMATLDSYDSRLTRAMAGTVERRTQRLADIARALPRPEELTTAPGQRLDAALVRLPGALRAATQAKRMQLDRAAAPLRPAVLQRQSERMAARLERAGDVLQRGLVTRTERARSMFERAAAGLLPMRLQRDLDLRMQDLDRARKALSRTANAGLDSRKERLAALEKLRLTLGYEATLERGYAVVWSGETVLTTRKSAQVAADLEIQFRDGRLKTGATSKPAKTRRTPKPRQASLFDD